MRKSLVRESRLRGKRKRATGACSIFTGFLCCFLFRATIFLFRVTPEFAVGGFAGASMTGTKEIDNGEGSDEVADHPGYR
jgi:hypothetical protein